MLLVFDVGNSNTVIGLYNGDTLLDHWRLETKKERTADELGVLTKELLSFSKYDVSDIKAIAIANVVPPLALALTGLCERYFQLIPFVVSPQIKTGLKIILDNPQEIGADRIVNAVAAYSAHKKDLIIIDFGTATTLDVVSSQGEYLGGVICPGIVISAEALFQRTSKLPRVEIVKPARVIGSNTVACIQSGLYFGYTGMIDSLVKRIQIETGKKYHVIATGGLAQLIAKDSKTIAQIDDLLTLTGLRLLYELNL